MFSPLQVFVFVDAWFHRCDIETHLGPSCHVHVWNNCLAACSSEFFCAIRSFLPLEPWNSTKTSGLPRKTITVPTYSTWAMSIAELLEIFVNTLVRNFSGDCRMWGGWINVRRMNELNNIRCAAETWWSWTRTTIAKKWAMPVCFLPYSKKKLPSAKKGGLGAIHLWCSSSHDYRVKWCLYKSVHKSEMVK